MTGFSYTDLQIIRQYLFGRDYKDAVPDLLSSDRIRSPLPGQSNEFIVSADEYMNSSIGAGRFAIGSMFNLVNLFFAPQSGINAVRPGANNDWNAINFQRAFELQPGRYSKRELANALGFSSDAYYGFTMQQYTFSDGRDDLAARTFIYGSSGFKLADDDDLIFVIEQDGTRYIENFKIVPDWQDTSSGYLKDNFDYESGNFATTLAEGYLQAATDPSEIGQTVYFRYANEDGVPKVAHYGLDEYLADINKSSAWSVESIASRGPQLLADVNVLLDQLWNSGITRFLDDQNRPILYGSDGDSVVIPAQIFSRIGSYLVDYETNGLVIIEDDGNDFAHGGDFNDEIRGGGGDDLVNGHDGDDTLYGEGGADKLYGDDGEDTLYADAQDTVIDGGSGHDTADYSQSDSAVDWEAVSAQIKGIEVVIGSDFGDTFTLPSNLLFPDDATEVRGGKGDDRLTGNDARNVLDGGDDNDNIWGGAEDDVLTGGDGDDRIEGGDSTYLNPFTSDKDRIFGGSGNDIVDGGADDDVISGDDGDDQILGGRGKDVIDGGIGNDILIGGFDVDTIKGGSGNDILDAAQQDGPSGIPGDNASPDQLWGGAGADIFLTNNGDVINDIDRGDTVKLDGVRLIGGERERPPANPCNPGPSSNETDDGAYEAADGTIYSLSGTTLTVTGPGLLGTSLFGSSITIQNFQNGDAGIRLKNTRPDQEQAECQRDPLIIDLNRDREVVRELFNSTAYFDLDNDGFAERVAWSLSEDGFLAIDRDGNGRIDDGTELFGTGRSVRHGSQTIREGNDGFAELATMDSNGDFQITSADTNYGELRVWVDANADAITDEGELKTLAELGIVSIGLRKQASDDIDCGCDGTEVVYMSSVAFADGSLTKVYDAYLSIDQYDSVENNPVEISAEVAGLPNILGSGVLGDLDVAMTRDPALREMVQALVDLPASQAGEIFARVEQILLRWTGSDGIAADARGPNMNARWLNAIEVISGSDFQQARIGSNPRGDAATLLSEEWQARVTQVAGQLLGQSALGAALMPGLEYKAAAFFTVADGVTINNVLQELAAHAPENIAQAIGYWHVMLETLSLYGAEFDLTDAQIDAAAQSYLSTELPFSVAEIRRAFIGGSGSGLLSGTHQQNLIQTDGRDLLVAMPGVTDIQGFSGNDVYVLSRTNGAVRIEDSLGRDTLFLTDLDPSDITISFDIEGVQPSIRFESTDGTFSVLIPLRIDQQGVVSDIETVRFENGEEHSVSALIGDRSLVMAGNDLLVLGSTGGGSDLSGGTGNDLIVGYGTADRYHFGLSSGSDTIFDYGSGSSSDRVIIDAPRGNVTFSLSDDAAGTDLLVHITGSDAQLRIRGQRLGGGTVEIFEFSDGSTLSLAEVDLLLNTGGAGNDDIRGSARADIIDGGEGNDVLRGGAGQDSYRFGIGSGEDRVIDADLGNEIVFGNGIAASDLIFTRSGSGGRDLLISITGSDDRLLITNGLAGTYVSQLRFVDGTSMSIFEVARSISEGVVNDITGSNFNNHLTGSLLDERLFGFEGSDILEGGGGNDSYIFSSGFDQIIGSEGGFELLIAPVTASINSLRISGGGYVQISFKGEDGLTTLGNEWTYDGDPSYSTATAIEGVLFSDGTVLDISAPTVTLGGAGNDVLYSFTYGDRTYTPGEGNDLVLSASGNNDVIVLGSNFGQDVIVDQGGDNDRIRFTDPTVNASSLQFRREGFDLVVSVIGTLDQVTIENHFRNYRYSEPYYAWGDTGAIEFFEFADNSVLTHRDILNQLSVSTPGDDWIMTGVRDGGAGDDTLVGDDDETSYVFSTGYGHDTVKDTGSTYSGAPIDTVQFAGLNRDDVEISRSDEDPYSVIFTIKATGETLTIDGTPHDTPDMAAFGSITIEQFMFGDVTLSAAQIRELLIAAEMSDGNDTITGFNSDTTIDGAGGDDRIYLSTGNETIVIRANSGHDVLRLGDAYPTLLFEGMTPSDIAFIPVSEVDGVFGKHVRIETASGASITVMFGLEPAIFEGAEGSDPAFELAFGNGDRLEYIGQIGALVPTATGTIGDDILTGDVGGQIFDPGAGNDRILGQGWYDTVVFGKGSGHDQLYAAASDYGEERDQSYIIELLPNVIISDVILRWSEQYRGLVELGFADAPDTLTFDWKQLSGLFLADGTEIALVDETDLIWEPVPSQTLDGNPGDTLPGFSGYDEFVSNAGGVTVEFGVGSALDHFSDAAFEEAGSEADLDPSWTPNSIRFDGITNPATLLFVRDGSALTIVVRATGDTLTIANQFELSSGIVGSFVLDGGQSLSWNDVQALIEVTRSEDPDFEVLSGNPGDTVTALPGDEALQSVSGGVTFVIPEGSGNAAIWDWVPLDADGEPMLLGWTANRIVFADVAGPAELNFRRDGDDLIIINGATGDYVSILRQFKADRGIVAEFEFEDGRVMTWSQVDDFVIPFGETPQHASNSLDVTVLDPSPTDAAERIILREGDEVDSRGGDDTIISIEGGATVIFGEGDGNDRLRALGIRQSINSDDAYNGDTIRFEDVMNVNDLRFLRAGDGLRDLVIELRSTGERLTVEGQFGPAEDGGPLSRSAELEPVVATFILANGTTFTWEDIYPRLEGIDLGGNNVVITGGAGGILDGGSGQDSLQGGTGNDVYVFDRNYGEDVIRDAGGADVIRFGAGVGPQDVFFSRVGTGGGDLLIEVNGLERLALTVEGQFSAQTRKIEQFLFDDGSTLGWQDIQQTILANASTSLADTLLGFASNDRIAASVGNDTVRGAGGDDQIDGGEGRDLAVYSGKLTDYTITRNGSVVTVHDLRAGSDGTDTLNSVEDLQFLGDGPTAPLYNLLAPNRAPVITPLERTIDEDGILNLTRASLTESGADADGDVLRLARVFNASSGDVWIGVDGNVRFRLAVNANGDAWFDYELDDQNGGLTVGRVAVTINPVNDLPSIGAPSLSGLEDVVLSGSAVATDVDGDTLVFSLVGAAQHGEVVVDQATGAFSFTPTANYFGADQFVVGVSDGHGGTANVAINVNLASVNDAPVVTGGTVGAVAATTGTGQLAASDIDGDTLSYSVTQQAQSGSFTLNGRTGAYSYRARLDATGSDSVIVRVTDAPGASATTTLTFTITPAAMAVSGSSANEGAASGTAVGTVVTSAGQTQLTGLTYALTDNAGGRFAIDAQTGAISIAGVLDYETATSHAVTVQVSDGASSISQVFALTVVNAAPSAITDGNTAIDAVAENAVNGTVVGITALSSDPGGGAISYSLTDNAGGRFAIDAATGVVTVANGALLDYETATSHQITVKASDGALDVMRTFSIALTDVSESNHVVGTSGADDLDGGAGVDLIEGLAGNDLLIGFGGNDTLDGGAGSDELWGDAGFDSQGGGSSDAGDDLLIGGSGDDYLFGQSGNDTLIGGSGDDVFDGDEGTDIAIYAGSSTDYEIYIDTDGSLAVYDLTNGDYDSLVNVEQLRFDGDAVTLNASELPPLGTAGNDTIVGTNRVDDLFGFGGNDSLLGGGGSDYLDGGAGNDSLEGGAGADFLYGRTGDDQLLGGDGDDTFEVYGTTDGYDSIDGGSGNDTVNIYGNNARLGLTSITNVETITAGSYTGMYVGGSANADSLDFSGTILIGITKIDGGAGNDTIIGSAGADTIIGSGGDDMLSGGTGDDVLRYSGNASGFDAINGGAGNDTIQALANNTVIGVTSLTGVETITAGAFTGVIINGSSGNDFIDLSGATLTGITQTVGQLGNDTIIGSAGADTLNGFNGDDSMVSGAGDDTFLIAWTGSGLDWIDGGAGNDTIQVTVNNGSIGLRSLTGVEAITAAGYSGVTIAGTSGNDLLDFSGTTITNIGLIYTGVGNDTIIGSAGADTIAGGNNDDSISGGAGDDVFRINAANSGTDAIDGGAGNDTIQVTVNNGILGLSSLANVEAITGAGYTGVSIAGSGNNDSLDFTNVALTNITKIDAGAGNDTVLGSAAADSIMGGNGNDRLGGGVGNDTIHGGLGDDVYLFNLGDGQDVLREFSSSGAAGGTDILQFGAGIAAADILVSQNGDGQHLVLTVAGTSDQVTIEWDINYPSQQIEQLKFADGTTWTHANLMTRMTTPTSGHDNLFGTAAANTIDALAGNDTLTGWAGNDTLRGGADNDRLVGGVGNDSLDGGTGSDVAVFAGDQSTYTITTSGGTIQIVDTNTTADGNDGTDTLVGVETAEFKGGTTVNLAAPIVLDLDGNGVGLVNRTESEARFDWTGDGVGDRTGWVGEGDGLLVYDRNGDGTVSGANELSFVDDKPGARSDLDGLGAFDSNGDGLFSNADDQWASFKVWQDRNGDGVAGEGELFSLADAGVASITLAGTATEQSWGWGDNITINTGSFTRSDGSTAAFSDVALNYTAGAAPADVLRSSQQLADAMASFGEATSAAELSAFREAEARQTQLFAVERMHNQ